MKSPGGSFEKCERAQILILEFPFRTVVSHSFLTIKNDYLNRKQRRKRKFLLQGHDRKLNSNTVEQVGKAAFGPLVGRHGWKNCVLYSLLIAKFRDNTLTF